MKKGMIDEEDELEGLLSDIEYFNLSEEQIKKLSDFKKRVDKALKEKNSKELKELVKERDKIIEDENEDTYFKKAYSYMINRNPLYLKLSIKEIKELFG